MNAIAVARFLVLWVIALPCYSDAVTTGIVYHPDYLLHDPGMSHPEGPARLEAIMSQLKRQGLLDVLINIAPEPAEKKMVARGAHRRVLAAIRTNGEPGAIVSGPRYRPF